MLLQESRDVIQRLGSRTHDADGPVRKYCGHLHLTMCFRRSEPYLLAGSITTQVRS